MIRLWNFVTCECDEVEYGNGSDADVEERHTRPPDVIYEVDEEMASSSVQWRSKMA